MMSETSELYNAILAGKKKDAETITQKMIEDGVDVVSLLENDMIPAMDEVGRRFEANEFFVPELLIAARAMKACMEHVKPILTARDIPPAATVAIGTVSGDLHDIGKNLVGSMLEGGGFEVLDLGVDVSPEAFVEAIRDKKATIIALSALLTTTMTGMKDTIDAVDEAGLRDKVKIMIGGAPITQRFSDEIGADGFSDSASGAVRQARELAGVS